MEANDRFSDTSAPYRCTLQLHCYDSSLPCVGFSANLYCIFSGPFVQKRSGRNECVHLSTATPNSLTDSLTDYNSCVLWTGFPRNCVCRGPQSVS